MREEFGLAIGIRRVVAECRNERGRKRCLDDETGSWEIPEEIILGRWRRKKTRPGTVFKGMRLPPGTWRAVIACLEEDGGVEGISAPTVRRALTKLRDKPREPGLRYPSVESLRVLVEYLIRKGVCDPVVLRHWLQVDPESPGIPDLFLYSVDAGGRVASARFVEVKRPDERLLMSQVAELTFLRGLGLRAGVVRLVEAPDRAR